MGNFSWITIEGRPIVNRRFGYRTYRSRKFTVYMHAPTCAAYPNGSTWKEPKYGGYGRFGGKDYFILLSEMTHGSLLRERVLKKIKSARTAYREYLQREITRDSKRLWKKQVKPPPTLEKMHEEVYEKMRSEGIYLKNGSQYPQLSVNSTPPAYFGIECMRDDMQGDYYDSDGESESEGEPEAPDVDRLRAEDYEEAMRDFPTMDMIDTRCEHKKREVEQRRRKRQRDKIEKDIKKLEDQIDAKRRELDDL